MSKNNVVQLTVDIQGRVSGLQDELKKVQDQLKNLTGPETLTSGLTEGFSQLDKKLKDLKEKTENNQINVADEKKIQQEISDIEKMYKNLSSKIQKNQAKFSSVSTPHQILEAKKAMSAFEEAIAKANADYKEQKKLIKDISQAQAQLESAKLQESSARQEKKAAGIELRNAKDAEKTASDAFNKRRQTYLDKGSSERQADYYMQGTKEALQLAAAQQAVENATKRTAAAEEAYRNAQISTSQATINYNGAVQEQNEEFSKLNENLAKLKSDAFDALKSKLIDLSKNFDFGFDPSTINDIEEFRQKISEIGKEDFEKIRPALEQVVNSLNSAKAAAGGLGEQVHEDTEHAKELNKELEGLKSRAKNFFSLGSAALLFRRALRSAFETVKDLDKVMTEMAVVTDYRIGDLWEKLPEYTDRANKLGVTIHDAYESMTIFLQQGLAEDKALQVSQETLKMARIAGLNAADATDRMTNALRGFNMELNAANAQRVDDVYNNLAAKTAANVDEISTAMTKVASLAHNANMEFETTAAFLAQIIETTRESAETAGTALKTVVARFSEVKKLYTTGDLIGADEEGEEIDVNKVSQALRSAGINMNEYLTGAKGLDDIFIELASKWDNLDKVQQRYIATMAAGSRQQSRFIAMMSDYKRTQELVEYATNASGFANEQYKKTLESLQTKLNKLKNAWDTLVTTVGNSTLFKGAIDFATTILTLLNDISDALPGITGELAKIGLIVAGFKIGKTVTSKIFDGAIDAIGTNLAEKIGKTLGKELPANPEASKEVATGLKGLIRKAGIKKIVSLGIGGALVAGAVAAFAKITYNESPEGQLKAAQKSLERINKQAKEVENTYSELNNSINNLTNKYSQLEELTYGTNEWKMAVHEVNNEVLNLIDKYPELAKFTKLEDSVLKVSDEGMNALLEKQQKQMTGFQISGLIAQKDVYEKELNKAIDNSDYGYQSLKLGERYNAGNIDREQLTEEIVKLEEARERKRLEDQGIVGENLDDALKSHIDTFLTNGGLEEAIKEIRELGNQSFETSQKVKTANQVLASAALSYADLSEEENKFVSGYMTGSVAATFSDKALKEAEKYYKEHTVEQSREEIARRSGYDTYKEYKEKVGKIDKGDITKILAGLIQAENAGKAVKTAVEVAKNLPEGTLKRLWSAEGGKGLSLQDLSIGAFEDGVWQKGNNPLDLWNQLTKEQREQLYNNDYTAFVEVWTQAMEVARPVLQNSKDFFESIGTNLDESNLEKISYEPLDKFRENLENIVTFNGEEAANQVVTDVQAIIKELDVEETEEFISALNSINWRDKGAIKDFNELLKDLGVQIDTESDSFKELTKDLINGSDAISKVNFGSLTKQIETLASLLAGIKADPNKRSFTNEEYESILKAAPEIKDWFVRTVSGWEYVGQHMEKLVAALDKNTDSQLNETTGQIGTRLSLAEIWDELKKDPDFEKQQERSQMVDLIAEARKRGVDFSTIGYSKLQDIDLSRGINDELLTEAFKEFSTSVFGQTATLKKQKEDIIQENIALKAATRNPVENAMAWNVAIGADKDTIQKALVAQAQAAGVARAEIDKYNKTMKKASETEKADLTLKFSHITMSYQVAERWGLEKDALDELAISLMKTEGLEEDQIDLAYDMAVSQLAASKGAKDIVDNFDNWDGVLWDSLDGLQKMKEGTGEYAEALNTLKEDLKLMLGTDVNFDEKLFSKNLPEILDYVKKISTAGSEEIATNLIDELNEKLRGYLDIGAELNVVKDDGTVENVWNEIQTFLDQNPLEAHLDDEVFSNQLGEFIRKLGLDVEQVNKLFDSLGYDVEIKWRDLTHTYFDPEQGEVTVVEGRVVDSIRYKPKGKADNLDSSTISKMGENAKKGKKDKNEHWENPYDELYNLSEKINESLRTREALERRYNQLLKDRSSNMKDIREEYNHNIEALHQEADLQSQMAQGRLRQIGNIGNEVYTDSEGNRATFSQLGVTKYASYDASTGHITIDWEGLEQLEKTNNVKKGEAAEAYISQLEEWVESYEEVRDALWDIEDKMEEFAQKVIDSYLSFEERVMDAVVHERQQQIDNYQTLSDAIKESNDKVIEAMRESIDMERQIRDNTKTEEDIADKEQRLAYLQRDTSGANQVEQMQLQKEIDDARQDYTDTLIDQAIETLSKQNEDAYEQRQEQIEMMQTQLNFAQAEGLLWSDVYKLMLDGMNEDGTVKADSALIKVLENSEEVASKSAGAQAEWRTKFDEAYKEAQVGLTELEAKYQQDFNGDLKVEDSDTRKYLSDIRNLAQQVTTQQAHGGAQGTSGGSGKEVSTPVNANSVSTKNVTDPTTDFIRKAKSEIERAIYAQFGPQGAAAWKGLSDSKNGLTQSTTIVIDNIPITIGRDDESDGVLDEIVEGFREALKRNPQLATYAR